ncbi:hypothetical protein [Rhodanobacter sp. B05]|uniref:hypothetical protein n=1 Tax=Rhodanobacter sp. B05 TaxID=1945859 RepID=UPI001439FE28|nr:hypothetical protein [Rhodanobacter sp. B05]
MFSHWESHQRYWKRVLQPIEPVCLLEADHQNLAAQLGGFLWVSRLDPFID